VREGSSARGDAALAVGLDALVGGRPRRTAAAVIDLATVPSVTFAFINADAATRFEIGSITKALSGMLLADSVQRGEISLDTVVADILPATAGIDFGSLTMKELCTHTSGLPRVARGTLASLRAALFAALQMAPHRGLTVSDVLGQAARQTLAQRGEPRYSNLGGAVLGQILAISASCDYPSLLAERIFRPIGMDASAVATKKEKASLGWSMTGLPRLPWVLDGYAPAGGVVSTIEDMARLAEALLGRSAPGLASMDRIEGVMTDRPNRASGMFWVIESVPGTDVTIIGHNGRTGGYSALLILLPHTRRAVIVLENVAREPQQQQRVAVGLLQSLPLDQGGAD
jgi:CubicO group peptidase (beta-lactamase class C family)